VLDRIPLVLWFRVNCWSLLSTSLAIGFSLLVLGGQIAEAQRLRIDVGGGWSFPTNNVELSSETFMAEVVGPEGNVQEGEISVVQSVDLKSGRHLYAGIGFVRSIADQFALGVRLRGHRTELGSSVDCRFKSTCGNPSGRLWAGTVEGRIILTSPDWINPYLLVGIGVVHTSVDGETLRGVESEMTRRGTVNPKTQRIVFEDVSITDAGGDVGIGASFPLIRGLELDGEFRVTGSLPGGKENMVTGIPLTLGLSYKFF